MLDDATAIARDVVGVARRAQLTLLAASLAYFSFVSLVPLALVVVVVLATLDPALAGEAAALAAAALRAGGSDVLERALTTAADRTKATVVGLVVLVWSALRLYRALEGAFSEIYGERKGQSPLRRVAETVLVFGTNVVALTLLGVAAVGVSVLTRAALAPTVAPVALCLALVAVFFPMFYVFPADDVGWEEALPGVALSAGAWSLASLGFRAYAAAASPGAYGAAGAVVLVLAWLYVGGLVLLVGVALNAVLADRVRPDDDWIPADYM